MFERYTIFFALAVFVLPGAVSAQGAIPNSAANTAFDTVVIESLRDPYKIAYHNILKGKEALTVEKNLAPDATFHWMVVPKQGNLTSNLFGKLTGNAASLEIKPDAEGKFDLPNDIANLGADVELLFDVKRGAIRLLPDVRSPDVSNSQRRLGDLRMECEIRWRMEYDDIPLLLKGAIKLMGSPCSSPKFGVDFRTQKLIKSAVISENGKSQKLWVNRGSTTFQAPIADKTWGNDAIIDFIFVDEQQMMPASSGSASE